MSGTRPYLLHRMFASLELKETEMKLTNLVYELTRVGATFFKGRQNKEGRTGFIKI